MPSATVILSWVPHAKGGRREPPPPGDYSYRPVVRFEADPQWGEGSWTLCVRPTRVSHDGRFWVATAEYLMPDAPHHLLKVGERFDLMEGRHVSAHGMVADPTTADSLTPDAFQDVLLV